MATGREADVNKEFPVPELAAVELATVMAALADPHRAGVVAALAAEAGLNEAGERACASFAFPVAKSTRTHHWRVLREAGLIRQRDAGNGTFVRLRRDEFEDRFPGLLDVFTRLATQRGPAPGAQPA